MVHKFDAKGAPKIYLVPVVAVLIVGGSVTLLVLGQILIGVVALAVTGWICYHLIRFTMYHLRSHVRTEEDELVCITSMGGETRMEWADLTHAGTYTAERGGIYLFVYNESADELLTIPPNYSGWESLQAEVRSHAGRFLSLLGPTATGIAESLKPHLA